MAQDPKDAMARPGMNSLSVAFPTAIIVLIILLAVFQFKDVFPFSFSIVLWVMVPLLVYLLSCVMLLVSQTTSCGSIDGALAFKGGLAQLVTTWLGIGVSSLSFARIPVASVMAPLLSSTDRSTTCCRPSKSLEEMEQEIPLLKGLSFGFYAFFASLFGMVMGSSIASTC